MTVKCGGKVVMEESSPLDLEESETVQTLKKHAGEDYFGGGTQNGRFIHTGNSIRIANESNWVDGGVASPNPFYWSDNGYGVMRNTFEDGKYDFGKTDGSVATARHYENELDAYYFVADASTGKSTAPVAQKLLQEYFKVTGNPILLPEYAFYLGHLNAYNRDMWSSEEQAGYKKWQLKGSNPATSDKGNVWYEKGGTGTAMQAGSHVESLNGHGATEQDELIPDGVDFPREFSAQRRLKTYGENDMPLGYFLPNDGYGAGYGVNGFGKTGGVNEDGSSSKERLAAVAANVENLKEFADFAKNKGVATGLWTQSYLTPDSNPDTPWQLLRDFRSEVKKGGVTTLKTDVAWVGYGYSMALDGVKTGYDIVTEEVSQRPNIISLDGWAGTQRFAAIWSGDQTGGNWEYIRFHIPTYIGQSLSGNPNIGSDMDGIFGGQPIIATRDYQWKTFSPLMLDMDGWGTYLKSPAAHGDPYTGISRMYLKLKSSLMPYLYTTAASASNIDTGNGDAGLPMVRAILLSDASEYAQSTKTQYEYTFGDSFLVAPVYQNTAAGDTNGGIGSGDDVRNGIYLPGDPEKDIWIDYFTGDQYRAGQVLNNFDAPLWKLPLFVKANAIVPMYEPNDNPQDIDRTKREVEFFAIDGDNEYTLFEDTGTYVENKTNTEDEEYGKESTISYGSSVKTKFTSSASAAEKTATFKAGKSEGTYEGYQSERTTVFTVNVSAEPGIDNVVAKNGDTELKLNKVDSLDAFEKAAPAADEAIYFYEEAPNLNYGATAESEQVRNEEFSKTAITTTPKLHVKFAKANVNETEQTLEVKNFANTGKLFANELNKNLAAPANLAAPEDGITPTSIKVTWDKVADAKGYELEVDGVVNSIGDATEFTHVDLSYSSEHTYRVRSINEDGFSEWSDLLKATSGLDPWLEVPVPEKVTYAGSPWSAAYDYSLAFDHIIGADAGAFVSAEEYDAVIGLPLDLDYGKVFQFNKLEFRGSIYGNGVKKMKIESSLDGEHWVEKGEYNLSGAQNKVNTVNFDPFAARYIRMTPLECERYFNATEISFYKVDGSEAQETGSLKAPATVGEEDSNHLPNCYGRENRGTGVSDWNSHIVQSNADYNLNEAYDVYDMSFTMSKLDGGTTKEGDVSGHIAVVPEKTSVKAGETITVAINVKNAKNVNAMGALIKYPAADFEFVRDSIVATDNAKGMENHSGNYTFGEELNSVNIALVNRGDKDLYNGSEDVVTFKLTAKKDCELTLDNQAWLVGPKQDFLTDKDVDEQIFELKQAELKITMTNDELKDDDGSNVGKLIQNGSYDGLFNDKEGDNGFEFKWDMDANFDYTTGKLPEYVKLPTTMHFELKEPKVLRDVQIINRKGSGNGTVTSMKAVVTYTDGTTSVFEGGDFATQQDVYTLTTEKGKQVKSVDITPLTSNGVASGFEGDDAKNRMLTLNEINFHYTDEDQEIVTEKADKVNLQAKYDELKDKANDGYTEGSWNVFQGALADAKAVLEDENATQDAVDAALKALTDADASLTKGETPNVNKADLQAKFEELKDKANDGYTDESWNAFQGALDAAKVILEKEDATQDEVTDAYNALVKADEALTKVDGGNQGGNGGNQGGNTGNGGNQGGNTGKPGTPGTSTGNGGNSGSLVQTGDPAMVAVAGTGIIGSALAAAGMFFRRRRNK